MNRSCSGAMFTRDRGPARLSVLEYRSSVSSNESASADSVCEAGRSNQRAIRQARIRHGTASSPLFHLPAARTTGGLSAY